MTKAEKRSIFSVFRRNAQTQKKQKSNAMQTLQRLGKSLLYPIAILPFAALLNRFGALLSFTQFGGPFLEYHWLWWIGKIIQAPGLVVFNNIALVFAIGVGFGYAKDFRGEAALVSGVSFLALSSLMGNAGIEGNSYKFSLPYLFYKDVFQFNQPWNKGFSQLLFTPGAAKTGDSPGVNPAWSFETGVFGGIVTALTVAYLYNRYKEIQLPRALSFFGGRRFIPMLGLTASLGLAIILAAAFPWVNYVLTKAGTYISNSSKSAGELGARFGAIFTYGLVNRLLQPFGLHHILNTFLWFQLPITGENSVTHKVITVNGDINAYQKNVVTAGIFTTCFFPLFLGGLPGAATAMTITAEKSKRKQTMFFLLGVGIVAFLTGIDEPLAFLFIFISPMLWIVHSFLTAIFCGITSLFNMHITFGFSAGLIDYLISLPQAWIISVDFSSNHVLSNPLWVWPLAVAMFFCYLVSFTVLIRYFKIPTLGREGIAGIASARTIGKNVGASSFTEEPKSKDELEAEAKQAKANPVNEDAMSSSATAPQKNTEVGSQKRLDQMSSSEISKLSRKELKRLKKEEAKNKYVIKAQQVVDAVGVDNIEILENCATRLRLIVKDASKIDQNAVKKVSPTGLIVLSNTSVQIVIGTDVELVVDPMREILNKTQK